MEVISRSKQLSDLFSLEKKIELKETNISITPFEFKQSFNEEEINSLQANIVKSEFSEVADNAISENKTFNYCVFSPKGKAKADDAILLLHGLNERSWNKYLIWAEYLTETTGKPVILFPIAFHINRAPLLWSNARALVAWVEKRKLEIQGLKNSTFVNIALSSRISQNPFRFYASGRETVMNIWQLMKEIKEGKHLLFKENANINLFGYSIGALLSNVLMISNPDNLFDNSKLFMFCGGSIFSKMNANARDIIDEEANSKLQNYYTKDFFLKDVVPESSQDSIHKAFKSLLLPDKLREFREDFFTSASNRVRAITLKDDIVIPTAGAVDTFGRASDKILEEIDFPYTYTHQWAFPLNAVSKAALVNESFRKVFDKAADFVLRTR